MSLWQQKAKPKPAGPTSGAFVVLVDFALTYGGGFSTYGVVIFSLEVSKTTGVVLGIEESVMRDSEGTEIHQRQTYRYQVGRRTCRRRTPGYAFVFSYDVGDKVPLLYRPGRPDYAVLDNALYRSGIPSYSLCLDL